MSEESSSRQVWQALAAVVAVGSALLVKRQLEGKRTRSTEPSIPDTVFRANSSAPSPKSIPPSQVERPHDSTLPSPEQIKALYREARAAQERGDIIVAEQLYRTVARLYDEIQHEPSVASITLAVSLYQLGAFAAARSDTENGINDLRKAAEVFQAVAQAAAARGATDLARHARAEAAATTALIHKLTAGSAVTEPEASGSPSSSLRGQQLETIRRLDAETARNNQTWAQGLGRI